MRNVIANTQPYVVTPPTDGNNFANNKLCVVATSGTNTVVLPSIAALPSNDFQVFVYASGVDGAVTVEAQGSDGLIGATGAVTNGKCIEYKAIASKGGNTWFARGK